MSVHSGYIYRTPLSQDGDILSSIQTSSDFIFFSRLKESNWFSAMMKLPTPLEESDLPGKDGSFYYRIFGRKSGNRYIFCSTKREAISFLAETILPRMDLKLYPQGIDIDRLVRLLISNPDNLSLSYIHTRVTNSGVALRSMSLYGDDLGGAKLVLENAANFNFYSCGISLGIKSKELVRLGTNGSISIHGLEPAQLKSVEDILGFVNDKGLFVS